MHPKKHIMNYRLRRLSRGLLIVLLGLSLVGCGIFDEESYAPPEGDGPWILVDLYHTRLQNHEDYRLGKWDYNYQGVYGFYRAFEHLIDHGYKVRSIRDMPLSAERLKGFDILFINLVDSKRPNFSQQEYAAIQQWVREGGGLFVIGDHTNVYRSSERINPLLAPMGMEMGYHTTVDEPPEYAVNGKAWLMLWDFDPHFVTRGVDMISPQTGGPILGEHGVAWTSKQSYGDYWDETDTGGFYGNWRFDGDESIEPRGPLAMVSAADYGDGRVVVVGDQNIFGDAWLYFADNFDLMMNSFQWLAGREGEAPLRAARPSGYNIGLDMSRNEFNLGGGKDEDFYPFYVNFNRDHLVTARARLGVDTDDEALFIMNPSMDYDAAAIRRIRSFFKQGKTVVLSFEADAIEPATIALLAELAPDFSLRVGGEDLEFVTTPESELSDLDIAKIAGTHPIESEVLDVEGLKLSMMRRPVQNPSGDLPPYLLDISSTWGSSFVSAMASTSGAPESNGIKRVEIARRKKIDNGELVVFLQDGFFRNRTLGHSEVTPPTEQNRDAIEFQYRLIDYLKMQRR